VRRIARRKRTGTLYKMWVGHLPGPRRTHKRPRNIPKPKQNQKKKKKKGDTQLEGHLKRGESGGTIGTKSQNHGRGERKCRKKQSRSKERKKSRQGKQKRASRPTPPRRDNR